MRPGSASHRAPSAPHRISYPASYGAATALCELWRRYAHSQMSWCLACAHPQEADGG